jgi:hypothetical protein
MYSDLSNLLWSASGGEGVGKGRENVLFKNTKTNQKKLLLKNTKTKQLFAAEFGNIEPFSI